MSGIADLAVVSNCIYINGANSTFNFTPDPQHHLGVTPSLGG